MIDRSDRASRTNALLGLGPVWGAGFVLATACLVAVAELLTSAVLGVHEGPWQQSIAHSLFVGFVAGLGVLAVARIVSLRLRNVGDQDAADMAAASPHPLFLTDETGAMTHCNAAWLEFTGRTLQQELSASRRDLVHPDDVDAWERMYVDGFNAREPVSGEYRMRRCDGSWRRIRSTASPRIQRGVFLGYAGVCEDVTEARATERGAERLNTLLGSIIKETPTIVFAIDRAGNFTYSKGAGLTRVGLVDDEAVGMNVFDTYPDVASAVRDALAGRRVQIEYRVPARPEEGVGEVVFQSTMIPDPETGGIVGFSVDLSEAAARASTLEKQQRNLAALLDAGPSIAAGSDVEGVLNAAADAIVQAGWGSCVAYAYDESFELAGMGSANVPDEELETLRSRAMSAEQRRATFSGLYDRFRVHQSYFIPEEDGVSLCEPPHRSRDGVPAEPDAGADRGWRAGDVAFIPLRGSDGRVLGRIDVDEPQDGLRPSPDVIRFLESFAELASQAIERLEREDRERALLANQVLMVSALPVVIWNYECDADRFTYVSERAQDVLGYGPEAWDDFDSWMRMIHPADREQTAAFCKRQTEQGADHEMVYRISKPDGEVLWIREIVNVHTDEQGKVSLYGIMIDQSRQREMEDRLRLSEAFLQSTIDGLGAEIAVLDVLGEIKLTNWSWGDADATAGEYRSRLRGRDGDGNPIDYTQAFDAFCKGSATTLRLDQPLWDAQRGRWYQVRASAFAIGQERNIVLSREDVSAIQAAQQGLATSESRYRAIVENQDEIVVRYDPDLVFTFVNPAYCALRGFPEHALLGARIADIRPADQVALIKRITKRIASGMGTQRDEQLSYDPNGDPRYIAWTHQGVFDDAGRLVEVQSVGRDTTQRRLAEEELKRGNEVQRLLLSELNHRVKNTLGGLIRLIELHADRSTDIDAFAARLTDRINSVLTIHSLLSSSKWSSLELRDIAKSVVPTALQDRLMFDGDPVHVRADLATPLGMVLQELVSNAVKHGAWSGDSGIVELSWKQSDGGRIRVVWTERGGPAVEQPASFNLGTELIHGFVRFELRGEAELTYLPDGVRHSLLLTLTGPGPDEGPTAQDADTPAVVSGSGA